MNKTLTLACAIAAPLLFSQSAVAEFDYFKTDGSFKRFSVSAGWLHASPQGKANPIQCKLRPLPKMVRLPIMAV